MNLSLIKSSWSYMPEMTFIIKKREHGSVCQPRKMNKKKVRNLKIFHWTSKNKQAESVKIFLVLSQMPQATN